MDQNKYTFEMLTELQESLLDLCSLLEQEREDISKLNIKGLDERRPRIENLNIRIRNISSRLSAQILHACKEAGLVGQQNLSAWITSITEPERNAFLSIQQTIHKVSANIDNSLLVNRGLLEDSLTFANQSLKLFTGMLKNTRTYGQAGRFIESVDSSRIINREI